MSWSRAGRRSRRRLRSPRRSEGYSAGLLGQERRCQEPRGRRAPVRTGAVRRMTGDFGLGRPTPGRFGQGGRLRCSGRRSTRGRRLVERALAGMMNLKKRPRRPCCARRDLGQARPEAVEIIFGEIPPAVGAVETEKHGPAGAVELRGTSRTGAHWILHARVTVPGQDGGARRATIVHAQQAGQDRARLRRVRMDSKTGSPALGRPLKRVGVLQCSTAPPPRSEGKPGSRTTGRIQDQLPPVAATSKAAGNRARRRRRSTLRPPDRRNA